MHDYRVLGELSLVSIHNTSFVSEDKVVIQMALDLFGDQGSRGKGFDLVLVSPL